MGVERAVRADQARIGRGELAAAVDHPPFGAHPRYFECERAHDVHAKFGRGVAAPRRHHGVHRAAQRRVEQGGEPAAMHRAQRVEVRQLRVALEHRKPFLDVDHREVQRLCDMRVRQLAAQQALHDFQPGLAGDLLRRRQPGARAGVHALLHGGFVGQPLFEVVVGMVGHGRARKISCRYNHCNCNQ
jgi:hypothetical protein